jgi:predicted amidohydrolase
MKPLRIALVQMNCEKAATGQNLAAISQYLAEAREREMDFICFPEMSISGYADPTRYPQAILRLDGAEVRDFLDRTRGNPAVVLAGLIEENPGKKPFITQIAAQNGELLGFYRKTNIIDEEALWFSAGDRVPVFQLGALTCGIAICADISKEEVYAGAARQGAQIVFELAAPGLYGEQATRNWQSGFEWWQSECQKYLSYYAEKYDLWIAVATQAGRTIDEDFPGGGYVFAPGGECLFTTPDGSAGAVYLNIDFEHRRVTPVAG